MGVGCSIAVTPECIVDSDPESVSDRYTPKWLSGLSSLRSVTFVWLGAAAVGSNPTLHQRVKSASDFWYISPHVISFLHVVLIKSRSSLAVFVLSSLRLSYFFRVAMVVGCSIAATP